MEPGEGRHICHRFQDGGRGKCFIEETFQSILGKRRDWLGAEPFQEYVEVCLKKSTWSGPYGKLIKTRRKEGTILWPTLYRSVHLQDLLVLVATWLMVVLALHTDSDEGA